MTEYILTTGFSCRQDSLSARIDRSGYERAVRKNYWARATEMEFGHRLPRQRQPVT